MIEFEVKSSQIHGRGVFATIDLPAGFEFFNDVIPVKDVELKQYQYPWKGRIGCICAGCMSFVNHGITPNVKISRVDHDNLRKYFVTLRPIKMGEELILNYGNSSKI